MEAMGIVVCGQIHEDQSDVKSETVLCIDGGPLNRTLCWRWERVCMDAGDYTNEGNVLLSYLLLLVVLALPSRTREATRSLSHAGVGRKYDQEAIARCLCPAPCTTTFVSIPTESPGIHAEMSPAFRRLLAKIAFVLQCCCMQR